MSIEVVYTAEALATGDGRNGHVRTSDGLLDMDVALPKEMGGNGGATNPEQLFAAGYAACFHSAVRHIAGRARLPIGPDTHITARVDIGPDGSRGYALQVVLSAYLPGLEQAAAEKLVAQAHRVCPYSNATRGNIEVILNTTT